MVTRLQDLPAGMGGAAQAPRLSADAPLCVEVCIGARTAGGDPATIPPILKGICDRAELEARGRPEIGSIRIAVRCQPPVELHPVSGNRGVCRGSILVHPFTELAVRGILASSCAVSVLETYDGLAVDVIDSDDGAAVTSLVGSLHSAGHIRIGFLSGDPSTGGRCVGRRFEGFARGLAALGLGVNLDWILHADPGPGADSGGLSRRAARAILESGVTAFVCASDRHAYALIECLHASGIRVPEDCSVTGFDGIEPPPGLPRATSARAALEHIGSSALTRIINRIIYPSSPPRKFLVSPQPVAGATIAAPRRP